MFQIKLNKNVWEQKLYQNYQKDVHNQNLLQIEQKMLQKKQNISANENCAICGLLWPSI